MKLRVLSGMGLLLLGTVWAAEPFDASVTGRTEGDPLILQGDYTPPARVGAPVLICLHGLGSTRTEWAPLVRAAEKRGWGTYAYDARGHGRSDRTMSGLSIRYDDRETRRDLGFWSAMVDDLGRVAAALETQKGITPQQRVYVGASLGANVALLAAVSSTAPVALVLLSPGLDYAGLTTPSAASDLAVPTLFVSAKPDVYAHISVGQLRPRVSSSTATTWWAFEKGTSAGDHGTQLFNGKLEESILNWIEKSREWTTPH